MPTDWVTPTARREAVAAVAQIVYAIAADWPVGAWWMQAALSRATRRSGQVWSWSFRLRASGGSQTARLPRAAFAFLVFAGNSLDALWRVYIALAYGSVGPLMIVPLNLLLCYWWGIGAWRRTVWGRPMPTSPI